MLELEMKMTRANTKFIQTAVAMAVPTAVAATEVATAQSFKR